MNNNNLSANTSSQRKIITVNAPAHEKNDFFNTAITVL